MKNLIKVLGIIAMFAVIGLVSCEVDEEDQIGITVTGLPATVNGKYAYIRLFKSDGTGDPLAYPSKSEQISGSKVTASMVDEKSKNFGKEGNYVISLWINDAPVTNDNKGSALRFTTGAGGKSLAKGENVRAATDFAQEVTGKSIADVFPPPKTAEETAEDEFNAKYLGSYKTTYKLNTGSALVDQDEYIDFASSKSFKIYEKKNGAKDPDNYLDFVITKWHPVAAASVPSGYTEGFKFDGYIENGAPKNEGTPPNIYGSKTAPGFNQADITAKTDAWMFIYFKADKTFVRTAFSKAGSDQSAIIITGNEPTPVNRVYTKQQ